MNEQEMTLFKSTLETLQDIAGYLEKSEDLQKQVAIQERAKLDKPPKAQEFQDEIEGAAASPNKPTAGIAKEYISIPENPKHSKQEDLESSDQTMIKAEDDEEMSESESTEETEPSEEYENGNKSTEEMKMLLKDIRDALAKSADVESIVEASIKKAMPAQMDKMLRKMGFQPTRPDVVRLGLDSNAEVVKSQDGNEVKTDIRKSEDEAIKEAINPNKSYVELARMREALGQFNPFQSR
jgi:hypothetical protein